MRPVDESPQTPLRTSSLRRASAWSACLEVLSIHTQWRADFALSRAILSQKPTRNPRRPRTLLPP